MEYVLTLIAGVGETLAPSLVESVRVRLRNLGADIAPPVWLAPGLAADLPFEMLAPGQATAAARQVFAGEKIDAVSQLTAHRRKKLLVADMDSTIVTGETLDELADFAGIKDKIAGITARAMNGELDFKAALRERVGLLKDLGEDALQKTWDRIEYMGGAKTFVRTMRANGAHCVLVSGGFKFFTARVAEECGFHEDRSNDFVIEGGKLTGRVVEPILDRETKLATLIEVAGAKKIPMAQTLAIGDGANDLEMIRAAGLGVAYHAKPIVAEQARVRIDFGDLTSVLYAQGYKREEFVG